MLFWIVAAAMAALVGAMLAVTLVRGRVGTVPPAAYDLEVYRDQLREIDRDVAGGTVGAEEAGRLRAEIGRRLLAADAALRATAGPGGTPGRGGSALAGLLGLLVGGGAVVFYGFFGAPGMQDMPRTERLAMADRLAENRLDQAAAEARADLPAPDMSAVPDEYKALVARLREVLEQRPDDLRGLRLLAQTEMRLGNWDAARRAQQRLIAASGDSASAEDYVMLADLMVNAAGGYVSANAVQALEAALARDPRQPIARYFTGLAHLQVDRPDRAFEIWDQLLRDSRPGAPWLGPIRARITDVARLAGVPRYQPPRPGAPAASGPDAAAVAAAGDMTDAERQQMIRGMVARLAGRLADEGGSAEEWARLINAYGALGEGAKARDAWTEARQIFNGQPAQLETVRTAARSAGVADLPAGDSDAESGQ